MKREAPFVLYQIARFGMLTMSQLIELCEGRCRRTAIYDCILILGKAGYIERLAPIFFPKGIYRITPKGFCEALGRSNEFSRTPKSASIVHSVRVTDTLLELSRYENITGFATEFEIPTDEWSDFSRTKIPDGIIQVSRSAQQYELAVEVECEPKTWARCQEFVSKYRDVFEHRALCSGVILVCDLEHIYQKYLKVMREMGDSIAKRFLIVRGPDLPTLNPAIYGAPRMQRGHLADKSREHFTDGIQYMPIKSIEGPKKVKVLPPQTGG